MLRLIAVPLPLMATVELPLRFIVTCEPGLSATKKPPPEPMFQEELLFNEMTLFGAVAALPPLKPADMFAAEMLDVS